MRHCLLYRAGHFQRRVQMLVVDDDGLVHLPHLVEHAVGKGIALVSYVDATVTVLADLHPFTRPRRAEPVGFENEHRLVNAASATP